MTITTFDRGDFITADTMNTIEAVNDAWENRTLTVTSGTPSTSISDNNWHTIATITPSYTDDIQSVLISGSLLNYTTTNAGYVACKIEINSNNIYLPFAGSNADRFSYYHGNNGGVVTNHYRSYQMLNLATRDDSQLITGTNTITLQLKWYGAGTLVVYSYYLGARAR